MPSISERSRRAVARREWLAAAIASVAVAPVWNGCEPTDAKKNATASGGSAGASGATSSGAVRVLVVDDPTLAEALAFESRFPAKIEVRQAALEAVAGAKRFSADVVVFPSEMLGTLAENEVLAAVPQELLAPARADADDGSGYPFSDMIRRIRRGEASWGKSVLGASLGSPQLALACRVDELSKLDLEPPETWDELDEAVQKMRGAGGVAHAPYLEPCGPIWSARATLLRAASLGWSETQTSWVVDYNTLAPRFSKPHFVEALRRHVDAAPSTSTTPRQAWQAVVDGQAAMALVMVGPDSPPPVEGVWIGPTPGSRKLYSFDDEAWKPREAGDTGRCQPTGFGGLMVCVTREARRPQSAYEFLGQLVGENAGDLAVELFGKHPRAGFFSQRQIHSPQGWLPPRTAFEWAQEYAKTQDPGVRWSSGARLPGGERYLAAFDAAIAGLVASRVEGQPLEDARIAATLAEIDATWEAITNERGRARQIAGYHRCLGADR